MSYPLFVPPQEIAGKPVRQWKKKEARACFAWLQGELAPRVAHLLEFLDLGSLDLAGNADDVLAQVGERAFVVLREDPAHSEYDANFGWQRLSPSGYALAADIGLLMAALLLRECAPEARWDIAFKSGGDSYKNLPVIAGLEERPFDPVGGSIGNAAAIVRGEEGPGGWLVQYRAWRDAHRRTHRRQPDRNGASDPRTRPSE